MKPSKFCIDCQHMQPGRELFIIPVHLCGHPSLCDPVTRKALHRCHEVRADRRPCGPAAKLFRQIDNVDILRIVTPLAAQVRKHNA